MNDKIKKILSGFGILAAFGLGGAAIAGAQNDAPSTQNGAQVESADQDERNEADQKVVGADADRAGQAALQEVGGGKVLEVEKETPDTGADKAEPGDKPDSAQEQAAEQNTAYSVEVRQADGTTVEVSLDDGFNVVASEVDDEEGAQR